MLLVVLEFNSRKAWAGLERFNTTLCLISGNGSTAQQTHVDLYLHLRFGLFRQRGLGLKLVSFNLELQNN